MKEAAICIIHDRTMSRYVHMLCRTMSDAIAPGKLCFPGGKLDEGETPKDACIREVFEETQFKLNPDCMELCDVVMIGEYKTSVFRCWDYSCTSRIPIISDEHDSYLMASLDVPIDSALMGSYTYDIYNKYRHRLNTEPEFARSVFPGVYDIIAKAPVPGPSNIYEVQLSFYSGDADARHSITSWVPQAQKDELVKTLDVMVRVDDTEIICYDIDTWPAWTEHALQNTLIDWPMDCFSEDTRMSVLDSYTIWYYDHNGAKCECEVITR